MGSAGWSDFSLRRSTAGEIDTHLASWHGRPYVVGVAKGFVNDDAVQEQIDATVADAVARARSRQRKGPGLTHCEGCGAPIPDARRKAVPGVRLCIACQTERDRAETAFSGYNRRGSKDSQLR